MACEMPVSGRTGERIGLDRARLGRPCLPATSLTVIGPAPIMSVRHPAPPDGAFCVRPRPKQVWTIDMGRDGQMSRLCFVGAPGACSDRACCRIPVRLWATGHLKTSDVGGRACTPRQQPVAAYVVVGRGAEP